MTMQDVADKICLVTGTTGIGRASALRLAKGGATVIAFGIDDAANNDLRISAKGLAIEVDTVDVSMADAVGEAMASLAAKHGGLDAIVNCAAIHPYGTSVTTSAETFARVMAVNVGSIHLTAHFGVPLMEKRGGGSIVNLASVQGHACQPNVMAYVTSKGAIHAMTRALAVDHAAANIRANSISPGSVRTPLLALAARTFDGPDSDVDEVFRRFGAAHPLGRIGEPEEIADLVAFLVSDRSSFCTGGDFAIDGGLRAGLGVR